MTFEELLYAFQQPQPSLFLKDLDTCGLLESTFPEVYALQGRIQPEKHHPEGCAYVHTLLVMEEARKLGADDITMFAALVHDLGKAVTRDDQLPHHYNHESLGVPLVHAMCDRLDVPDVFRETGVAAAREHLNIHRFNDLKAATKVRLLMRLKVTEDMALARRVVMASKADARGRGPLFENVRYEQGDNLLRAAEILRNMQRISEQDQIKALKAAGFK